MITYINSKNAGDYAALFSKATQELIKMEIEENRQEWNASLGAYTYNYVGFLYEGETIGSKSDSTTPLKGDDGLYVAREPITTLEEYFKFLHLLVLAKGDTSRVGARALGRRYTKLPVDEDVFEINANTREISVPTVFKQNGIAVQGDEMSEIVYFKIDRFFDSMDLDTCDIYIQWTTPDGESGVSEPWVVDIESEPNKIIFGWVLSSAITKKAGSLKFSARFFKWNGESLIYSLSTLTQSATIKSALDFALLNSDNTSYIQDIETNDAVLLRIKNTNSYVTGIERAQAPEFLENLFEYVDLVELNELPANILAIAQDNNIQEVELKDLEVEARSVDGGSISYSWRYIDPTTNKEEVVDEKFFKIIWKEIAQPDEDKVAEMKASKKLFYVKDTKNDAYNSVSITNLDAYEMSLNTYYERVAICIANKVGTYFAIATNSKASTNSTTAESVRCIVPMPCDPVIETDLKESVIIGKENVVNDPQILKVVVTNAETNGTKDGKLTYTWWFRCDEAHDWEVLELDSESATYSIVDSEEAKENPQSIEGFYKVVAKNHKNGEDIEATSIESRVSYQAEPITVSYPTTSSLTNAIKIYLDDPASVSSLYYEIDHSWGADWNKSDGFSYQWFGSKDNELDPSGDMKLNEVPILLAKDQFICARPSDEMLKKADVDKYRTLYCQITNHKNGSVATMIPIDKTFILS